MFDLILKNGQVFWQDSLIKADLAINGEKIAAVGTNLKGKAEVDIAGKWILPGALDVHTHFSLPFAGAVSADDFYSGSVAGAAGGVTTFIDFTSQKDHEGVIDSLIRRKNEAEKLAAIDYSFHACIGRMSPAVIDQIPELQHAGVTSLKIFMAYGKSGLMQDDKSLLQIMNLCRQHGILLTVHAENGMVIDHLTDIAVKTGKTGIESLPLTRPVFTETEAIRRLGDFAAYTGCKTYVVHVSSGTGARIISDLRQKNVPIAGETCPQYLYLDNSKLVSPSGHLFGCCPPVREKGQSDLIWKVLEEGGLSVVATDHCPFTSRDKNSWNGDFTALPMGLPGIQTLPAFVLNGVHLDKISLKTAVNAITENPAKMFGLFPEKGSLIPGTDADIMIYNPDCVKEIRAAELLMKTDYSPYEGMSIRGCIEMTFLRGNLIFSKEAGWKGQKGGGVFVKRKTTDPDVF